MIFKAIKATQIAYVNLCITIDNYMSFTTNKLVSQFNARIDNEEFRIDTCNLPTVHNKGIFILSGLTHKNEIVSCKEVLSEKRKSAIKLRYEEDLRRMQSNIHIDYGSVQDPGTSFFAYSNATLPNYSYARTTLAATLRYDGSDIIYANGGIRMNYHVPEPIPELVVVDDYLEEQEGPPEHLWNDYVVGTNDGGFRYRR